MGGTRVELGVQNVYDDIYQIVERGHTVQDVITATRVAKDAGLKVCYHMMLGLPNSNIDRDLRGFKRLVNDPDFKPDMLKIYPCLVMRDTKIYDWWKSGSYRPYTIEEATHVLVQVKSDLPPWIRVMRIQRDIPAQLIVAGVKKGNLRQIVQERMKVQGLRCSCIRCREVGHRMLDGVGVAPESVSIVIRKYQASGGLEVFISAEDEASETLIGYLRLRFPSPTAHRPEVGVGEVSLVRELHVYGPLTPIGARMVDGWQHCGYGRALLKEAEGLSLEHGRNKILVTSGLGAREYFDQLGYKPVGPYMGKVIS
jgi:elongator complex protein 3